MKLKTLIALISAFTSSLALGYCANSYQVVNDAMDVQRQARQIYYEASRYSDYNLRASADRLASSAGFLASSARGSYQSCSMIRSNYNNVKRDYRRVEVAFRGGGSNRNLAFEMQLLAGSIQSLNFSISRVRPNPRRYDDRRYPRRHRPHRPAPPRRYDPTPRRPHRRVGAPGRGHGRRHNRV